MTNVTINATINVTINTMKRKIILFSLALAQLLVPCAGFACTAAVISGRVTPDGRPILWKNRDTKTEQNCVKYFSRGRYPFVAVVNSAAEQPSSVWAGTNSTGFSIMNTLSYNLKPGKKEGESGGARNGVLMLQALEVCSTVEDFRRFLDTVSHQPRRVEANFGVIDAKGGAAWFEVDDSTYVMFDANDFRTAPFGYIVRTNFSLSGIPDVGLGHVRYHEADRLLFSASATGGVTPSWIFAELTRSFSNPMTGVNLRKINCNESGSTGTTGTTSSIGSIGTTGSTGWYVEEDYIARKKSTCAVAIQGVRSGENPDLTVMWTSIGYPAVTPAVPVMVKGGDVKLPRLLVRDARIKASPLCNAALKLRNKVYSYTRGTDSEKYFRPALLFNAEGTGYLQKALVPEKKIIDASTVALDRWRERGKVEVTELYALYDEADTLLSEHFSITR